MSFKRETYTWKTFITCVKVHPDLEKELRAQSDSENELLKQSLQEEGMRDPISICNIEGKQYIWDGHHRRAAAIDLGLYSNTDKVYINNYGKKTLAEAIEYILRGQTSRRNLTEKEYIYIIGKIYNNRKVPAGVRNVKPEDFLDGLARTEIIETSEHKNQNKNTAEELAKEFSTDNNTITKNQIEEAAQKESAINTIFPNISEKDETKLVNSKVSLKDLRKVRTATAANPDLAEKLNKELKTASTTEEIKEVEQKVKSIAKNPEAFADMQKVIKDMLERNKNSAPVPFVYHKAPNVHSACEKYTQVDLYGLTAQQQELFDYFIEHGIAVANHKDEAFVSFCKKIGVYENVGRTRGGSTWSNPYETGVTSDYIKGTQYNCGYDSIREGSPLECLTKFRTYFSLCEGHHKHLDKLMGKILFCHGDTSLNLESNVTQAHLLEQYSRGLLDPTDLSIATTDLPFLHGYQGK